ncbi:MAG: hypothetical protein K0R24_1125 [Gammaproteobacteria bacterium]|jgi:DNA-binding GntR family transcriptional regulator|nr:hypothetical protein [Gammaproteobacteria bacterium]
MAALPAFDTHAYVKRLKAAGFNEAQAEAQAELQSDVLSTLITEKLATKEDIDEVKNDIKELRNELKNDIVRVENEAKQEFIRVMGRFNQLNWMIGFLLTGTVTILFKLFLHG